MSDWFNLMQKRNKGNSSTGSSVKVIRNSANITLFNSDKIDILEYGSTTDKWGVTRNGWTILQKDFVCDVQYATDPEKVTRDFGYDIKVSRIVYCVPNENLVESSIIRYEGVLYKITKIKKCKNYSDFDGDKYWKIAIVEHDQQNLQITEKEEDSYE